MLLSRHLESLLGFILEGFQGRSERGFQGRRRVLMCINRVSIGVAMVSIAFRGV